MWREVRKRRLVEKRRVLISVSSETFGLIRIDGVLEALVAGEIIEQYHDDQPFWAGPRRIDRFTSYVLRFQRRGG